MKLTHLLIVAGMILLAPPAQAQLLPAPSAILPPVLDRVDGLLEPGSLDRLSPARLADRLVAARTARIDALLRQHGDRIDLDDRREPARRGVLYVMNGSTDSLSALRKAGYDVEDAAVEGIEVRLTRLAVPEGRSLSRALREVRKLAPGVQVSADNLYFPGGSAPSRAGATIAGNGVVRARAAGLIDGGVAHHPALTGPIEQRGFVQGAPRPSAHGTAVASLISGDGVVRGAAPGTPLLVADVYGDDPAGGSAFAIVRALGWMAARGASVVTVSLVGPANPMLEGAIRLARDKGVTIVAAVGNDGPAAPPAYPASYPQVIAVTGIDGRDRPLPEAGRALHVDFAAPGADMQAASMSGGKGAVRGTSFAAPLVAGRLFARGGLDALRAEAIRPARGKSPILCKDCRNND